MNGLNKVMMIGNLGADPELRVTGSGTAVLNLRIAVTTTYLDRDNTRQERTEWANATVWGKRGEALSKFLAKGSRVYIEGELRTDSYEKDGEKRYATKVNVSELIMLDGKKGGESERSQGGRAEHPQGRQAAPARAPAAAPARSQRDFDDYGYGPTDDEIPF